MLAPVITYGCDWSTTQKINVFFIGKGRSIAAPEMFQMMNRVRNIKKLYYTISETKTQLVNYNVESVKTDLDNIIKAYVNSEKDTNITISKEDLNKYNILTNTHNIDNERWEVKNNLFTNLFLQNEYFDKVYRSNPEYHIRKILTSRGFNISDDDDEIKPDQNEINEVKDIELERKEELMTRIFKTDTLTKDEIKVHDGIIKRLDIANLNKRDFIKYKEIIQDDDKFTQFLNFTKLLKTNEWIEQKKTSQVFEDFRENRIKSTMSKISMIKYLLDCLNLSVIDINTVNDYQRFESNVDVDTSKIDLMIKIFRVRSNKEVQEKMRKGDFKELYFFIINSIKGIAGNNYFDKVRQRMPNNERVYCYCVNENMLNNYMDLYKNIDLFFENVDDKIKSKYEPVEMDYNNFDI